MVQRSVRNTVNRIIDWVNRWKVERMLLFLDYSWKYVCFGVFWFSARRVTQVSCFRVCMFQRSFRCIDACVLVVLDMRKVEHGLDGSSLSLDLCPMHLGAQELPSDCEEMEELIFGKAPDVLKRLAQGLDDLFVCAQKSSHHRSCQCWMFLRPRSLLFSHYLLPHWRHLLPLLPYRLESDQTLCCSARRWAVWSSGWFDPQHRLWAQVLHRCQWRAHADQPSEQKHELPAGVRRDDHRFWGP